MQFTVMLPIFVSVFLAELGDKTQLATLCFSAEGSCSKKEVFTASALALVLSSLLAVIFGSAIASFISPQWLRLGAGILFVIMGIYLIVEAYRNRDNKAEGCCAH